MRPSSELAKALMPRFVTTISSGRGATKGWISAPHVPSTNSADSTRPLWGLLAAMSSRYRLLRIRPRLFRRRRRVEGEKYGLQEEVDSPPVFLLSFGRWDRT